MKEETKCDDTDLVSVPRTFLRGLIIIAMEAGRIDEDVEKARSILKSCPPAHPEADSLTAHLGNTDSPHALRAGYNGVYPDKLIPLESKETAHHADPNSPTAVAIGLNGVEYSDGCKKQIVEQRLCDDNGVLLQPDGSWRVGLGYNGRGPLITEAGGPCHVVLGNFNTEKVDVPHRCHQISPARLEEEMNRFVGKPIGEYDQALLWELTQECSGGFKRVETVVSENAWGVLESFTISELGDGSLRVYGVVRPVNTDNYTLERTPLLIALRAISQSATVTETSDINSKVNITPVVKICGFDLTPE